MGLWHGQQENEGRSPNTFEMSFTKSFKLALSDIICPERLISLCNKAWLQQVFDNESRWPLEGTFEFAILCDLESVFFSVGTNIQNCHKSMVSGYFTLALPSVAGFPRRWSFWLEPHASRFSPVWVLGLWKFCPDSVSRDTGLFSTPLNSACSSSSYGTTCSIQWPKSIPLSFLPLQDKGLGAIPFPLSIFLSSPS